MRNRPRANGFTLIEMLVVIVIVAVLTSISVPRYNDFVLRARFREAVQRVISIFAEARNRAVQSGSECTVRYDPQAGMFIVESDAPRSGGDHPVALEEAPEMTAVGGAQPFELAENVTISDFRISGSESMSERNRRLQIRFYDDGRADGALIELTSEEGDRASIEIAPLTGRATVMEDEP
jgi:type II secretion system protein H